MNRYGLWLILLQPRPNEYGWWCYIYICIRLVLVTSSCSVFTFIKMHHLVFAILFNCVNLILFSLLHILLISHMPVHHHFYYTLLLLFSVRTENPPFSQMPPTTGVLVPNHCRTQSTWLPSRTDTTVSDLSYTSVFVFSYFFVIISFRSPAVDKAD